MLRTDFYRGLERARYALVDMRAGPVAALPMTFDTLEQAAAHVRTLRDGRFLELAPAQFVWGDQPAQTRSAINLAFRSTSLLDRWTLITRGEPMALFADFLQARAA